MMYKMVLLAAMAVCSLTNVCFSQTKDTFNMKNETSNKAPQVLFKTNLGEIKLELYPDKAPETVKNFLQYVKEGHYNDTIFHRVIDGFMIQGGGLTADFKQKTTHTAVKNEADNGLKNVLGSVAMARTSDPDSASAQFFINVSNNDFLDFKSKTSSGWGYTVFGKVIQGMDVVEKIKKVKTGSYNGQRDVPLEPITIESATEVKE